MRILIMAAAVFSCAGAPRLLAAEQVSELPSERAVLTFIGNTIDWYRQLPTPRRIGYEPADIFFLENNRPTAQEIVRLSFQFGKAIAAVDSTSNPAAKLRTSATTPADKDLPYLLSVKSQLDASAHRSSEELDSLGRLRLTADFAEREKLDVQIAETRTRIELLNRISASYETLADFVRSASADSPRASLASLIQDLERTVPEVSTTTSPSSSASVSGAVPPEPRGLMDRISSIASLSQKQRFVETAIERTDALEISLEKLRNPFRERLLTQLASFSSDEQNLNALEEQEALLHGMVAQLQTLSPALSALIKQEALLNLYKSHLTEWRSEIQNEHHVAWTALLLRLSALGAALVGLFAADMVVRRTLSKHTRVHETRLALLAAQRIFFWVAVLAVVLFAFAFDPASLATFFGLVTAGLAVGLRDVLLAIGGRTLLARRVHVGEQIEISGVRGQVARLGLIELTLNETDARGQATGREVYFANSYIFVSPATPLFREIGAPA